MSETQKGPPKFGITMHYNAEKNICVHVFSKEHPEQIETKEFSSKPLTVGVVEGVLPLKKQISEFCAAALIRINGLEEKERGMALRVFELGATTPGVSNGLMIEGDSSIEDIFRSKILMMDTISNDLCAFYDMESGKTGNNDFSKFYILGNRAISFKRDIPEARQERFLNAVNNVVGGDIDRYYRRLNQRAADTMEAIKKEVFTDDLKEMVERDDFITTNLDSLNERDANRLKLLIMTQELQKKMTDPNVKPEELTQLMSDIRDFSAKHTMSKDINELMQQHMKITEMTKHLKLEKLVPADKPYLALHNISEIRLNIPDLIYKLYGKEEMRDRFDYMAQLSSTYVARVTTLLVKAGLIKSIAENPDEPKQIAEVTLDKQFADFFKSDNMTLEDAFILGYMTRVTMNDVGRVPFQSKDANDLGLGDLP